MQPKTGGFKAGGSKAGGSKPDGKAGGQNKQGGKPQFKKRDQKAFTKKGAVEAKPRPPKGSFEVVKSTYEPYKPQSRRQKQKVSDLIKKLRVRARVS